ncbi:hypothetical protein COCCU_06100 [Corynebacterium occultum]|uniref:Uncharacterized protein n=1 Tax=Corynebacterium occultum TaxID=2675219 RepID=A0A6B8W0W2_9CORY|nr:hypothetical protein [Corynebacterium occultum]QGU07164.1 hypothetical protein COCCU_06100 [Corynebacterium occultum]
MKRLITAATTTALALSLTGCGTDTAWKETVDYQNNCTVKSFPDTLDLSATKLPNRGEIVGVSIIDDLALTGVCLPEWDKDNAIAAWEKVNDAATKANSEISYANMIVLNAGGDSMVSVTANDGEPIYEDLNFAEEFGTDTTTSSATSKASPDPVVLELGETANLTVGADGPRDINVRIDDISVSEQCHTGLNGYSDGPYDGYYNDHGYFIQITGEFEVIEHQVNYSVSGWDGTTADGYAVDFMPTSECNDPADDMPGFRSFSNPIDAGQKARAVEEYWVAELPENIVLDEPYEPVSFAWPVPQDISEPTPREGAPIDQSTTAAQETSATTPQGSSQSDPYAEHYYSSPDNPALAEHYAEQERLANIPVADGGTCPAYKCGYGTNDQGQRNPTSGEIQTLDGCQQGYITDPQLCEAVTWVETHQY